VTKPLIYTVHTADGFNGLIEGVCTLAGAWTTAGAGGTMSIVITTDVIHATTCS